MPTLLIINGYAGAGKSSTATELAKKKGFALISQDVFLFELNAFNKTKGGLTAEAHTVTIKNMHDCTLNYMHQKKDIVIEGALVSLSKKDSLDVRDFIKLGKRMKYQVIVATLVADDKIRTQRQKKRKYIVPPSIDKKLQKENKIMNKKIENKTIINTSKDSINTVVKKLCQLL